MERKLIIQKTIEYVKQSLASDSSGHDWSHIVRVWQTARKIAVIEGADVLVVELAALLHDIADWKFHNGDDSVGPRTATLWLQSLDIAPEVVAHVSDIISRLSFKGAGVSTPMSSREGEVVQDADRLDALGAIGIARAFAYGGHKGRAIFDPEQPPVPHGSFEDYKKNSGPTINHFYEKLLLLKDRMNTATAKQMAEKRHRFMEQFLVEFYDECGAPDWSSVEITTSAVGR